jgi:enoyl-CoA hydratase
VSELLVEQSVPGVTLLTLNRPGALNALSVALEAQLRAALVSAQNDPHVHAVVLTGAGRAFSAGVDLKEVQRHGFAVRELPPGEPSLPEVFEQLTLPVIAAVNGVAITGGFELALMCDMVIASREARFADTHARVGVVPGWGLSQRLPGLVGLARAKEISLTGNYVDADTAAHWGIVNRVVDASVLIDTAVQLGADVASCAGPVQSTIKQLIDYSATVGLAQGLAYERSMAAAHNPSVTGDQIGERRQQVLERGRDQTQY